MVDGSVAMGMEGQEMQEGWDGGTRYARGLGWSVMGQYYDMSMKKQQN